eukprot:NODE_2669_length_2169_cov_5.381978.p1 GENE.NODE_2669_length_2169_cov_5.381978~~NODE_2669_length_2169_cov_5.381978.p1  ORF type:complete len:543 (-),score=191.74 NODE_2669_length_2169_cov_5.381978:393-2021(-)
MVTVFISAKDVVAPTIIRRRHVMRREAVSRGEARRRIEALGEPYKLEILDSIKTEPITIYHTGDSGWWDLCAGPHCETTDSVPLDSFELESVAGAYWRGDESRAMLQRIYGTAWLTPEKLKAHQQRREDARLRDHRRLGRDLGLFSLQEAAGGGLVFWHPRGARIRSIIEGYWRDAHLRTGYELVYTPHAAKHALWETSGHADHYSESMFEPMRVEGELFQLKPMNCPGHILVYASSGARSYRELPVRYAELGTVYRYERSGTMHGLLRVRGFTQDDAHIFCRPDQIAKEVRGVLDLAEQVLGDFGFHKLGICLSTRPDEATVGSDELWERATSGLADAIVEKGWEYEVDEGAGVFYGPKIDIKIEDAIGRMWQLSTIQLDFNLPERFGLRYVDAERERHCPVMIHRAIFGSLERFFGILIEHTAGEFPFWLAPLQLRVIPVSQAQRAAAADVVEELRMAGVRAEVSKPGERLAKAVRTAVKEKIPAMCVLGAREAERATLSLRTRADGKLGELSVAEVAERINRASVPGGGNSLAVDATAA